MFGAGPSNHGGKRAVLPTAIEQEISHGILNLTQRLHQLQLLSKSEEEEEVVVEEETTANAAPGIINISGTNNGATMNIGFSPKEESRRTSISSDHTTINIYINTNVQGVNNSILYNSSCTLRDPGVQMDFSNVERSSVSCERGGEGSDPSVADLEKRGGKERKFSGRKRSWSDVVSESVADNEVAKASFDGECSTSVHAQIHGGSAESIVETEVTSKEIVKEDNLSSDKLSKVRLFLGKFCCNTVVRE